MTCQAHLSITRGEDWVTELHVSILDEEGAEVPVDLTEVTLTGFARDLRRCGVIVFSAEGETLEVVDAAEGHFRLKLDRDQTRALSPWPGGTFTVWWEEGEHRRPWLRGTVEVLDADDAPDEGEEEASP